MKFSPVFKSDIKQLIALAIPVFLASLSQLAMTVVDTIVAGRYASVDMAAIALAASFYAPVSLFGTGLLMALTPLTAQANGAHQIKETVEYLKKGMILGGFLSVFIMFLLYTCTRILSSWSSIEPLMAKKAVEYIFMMILGIPGLMFFSVQRFFLEGLGKTKPAMFAGNLGLMLNIPLNILFVFGKCGFPEMGAQGCGLATAILYSAMCLSMVYFIKAETGKYIVLGKASFRSLFAVLKIGFPSALAVVNEVLAFTLIALIIAPLGVIPVAADQIANNVTNVVWILFTSIGSAAGIMVGTCLGAGKFEEVVRIRKLSLKMCLAFACVNSSVIYFFRYDIAGLYTTSPELIEYTALLLAWGALYQFPDSTYTCTIFALRSWNDTKYIFVTSTVAYIFISLPLGYILCMTDMLTAEPLGVVGFWISLTIALFIGGISYLIRINKLERNPDKYKYLLFVR